MRRDLEMPRGTGALAALRQVMDSTWPIVERALFTRGHVFQYSSKIAPTLEEFFFVARSFHGREEWDPGSTAQVEPTRENVRAILREKDEALAMATELARATGLKDLGVSERLAGQVRSSLDLLVRHVRMYRVVVASAFLTAFAEREGDGDDWRRAADAVAELRAFRLETGSWLASAHVPFYVYWLFDVELLLRFENDLLEHLTAVSGARSAT